MSTGPAGVVGLVDALIARAIAARASDVHFEPDADGLCVRFRVDALLHDVERIPAAIAANVVARLKVLAGLLTYRTDVPQEGGLPAGADRPCDIRVATFPTIHGERVVLRLLGQAARLLGLDDLGHAADTTAGLRAALARTQGLVLVCGPAGSGKTTTLHALLAHLRATRPGASILSIEDPVEVRHPGITQIEVQPERGLTYAVALRSLLRQDPQVLMIGEVRDADTARLVIEAALTGHLLLSTLHSGSAGAGIVRLREMGLPPYQITSALEAVLAQRLVRTVCACTAGGGPAGAHAACPQCLGTGYAGRCAIGRLVTLSSELRQGILAGADASDLERLCPGSLAEDARRLVAAGRTTEEECRRILGSAET